MSTLYFAYGANTNLASMERRCPTARPVAPALLKGWRLVFRGVADIVREDGQEVFGALWRIEHNDEIALDKFEGYPRLYTKVHIPGQMNGERAVIMAYAMREREWMDPPSNYYEACLRTGYKEWGLPMEQLNAAIRRANRSAQRRFEREMEQGRLAFRLRALEGRKA
jgi:hypothetical protein